MADKRELERGAMFRDQYSRLERRDCSLVEWIALKLSCSRDKANAIVRALEEPDARGV